MQVTLQGCREAQRIAGMLGMIRIEWLGGAGHVIPSEIGSEIQSQPADPGQHYINEFNQYFSTG